MSGFPSCVLNASLYHMTITEVSKSWPSVKTLYSVTSSKWIAQVEAHVKKQV